MAYDLELAKRIRALIGDEPNLVEKPMFGGLAFLVNGNMSVAASGQGGLLLRCDPAQTIALTKKPHAAPMVMRGRPMEGWLRVAPEGVTTSKALKPWVDLAVGYARALPAKAAKSTNRTAPKSTKGSASAKAPAKLRHTRAAR